MRSYVRSFAFQVVLGLAAVVVAVASNRLLTDDGWNWWWTAGTVVAVLVLAAVTAVVSHLTTPPAPAAFVPVLDDVHGSPRPSTHFVGRDEDMKWLRDTLRLPGSVAVLYGLGGVGKTAVAAQYAYDVTDNVGRVLWVGAETRTTLEEGLATAAARLGVVSGATTTVSQRVEAVLAWLDENHDWLLVLDNVADATTVAPVLRHTRHGRAIVTTRHAGTWDNAVTRELHGLRDGDALRLLRSLAGASGAWDGGSDLVRELGNLPIAVVQAAAYLRQQAMTPAVYLDLLRNAPEQVLAGRGLGTPEGRTMVRVWQVTLNAIAAEAPLGVEVLGVLAWFAADDVPRTLLAPLPTVMNRRPRLQLTRSHRVTSEGLDEALGLLHAYSMIRLTATTISTHRLVQLVTRTPDAASSYHKPQAVKRSRERAEALLLAAQTDAESPTTWPQWRLLLPSIDAYADATELSSDTLTATYVLDRTGQFLQGQGLIPRAITLFQRSLDARAQLLGERDPDTLSSRIHLGLALQEIGRLEEAIELNEQTVTMSVRVLGEDHPHTLTARHDLALAYRHVGRVDEAIDLHEQELAGSVRVHGEDHVHTLTSRNNLANAYQDAGRSSEAVNLQEQTLAARLRVLGEDHPHTLTSQNNLATAYRDAGRLTDAIELHERTMAARVRVLGEDHPHTLASQNNLATAYRDARRPTDAINLHRATLAARVRVLGEGHPHTLASRDNLANAYQATGRLTDAIDLHKETLAARVHILGEDHPHTLISRKNLALAYTRAALYSEALAEATRNHREGVRIFGPRDRRVLDFADTEAFVRLKYGDRRGAIELLEASLATSVQSLGPDDQVSVRIRNRLDRVRKTGSGGAHGVS